MADLFDFSPTNGGAASEGNGDGANNDPFNFGPAAQNFQTGGAVASNAVPTRNPPPSICWASPPKSAPEVPNNVPTAATKTEITSMAPSAAEQKENEPYVKQHKNFDASGNGSAPAARATPRARQQQMLSTRLGLREARSHNQKAPRT